MVCLGAAAEPHEHLSVPCNQHRAVQVSQPTRATCMHATLAAHAQQLTLGGHASCEGSGPWLLTEAGLRLQSVWRLRTAITSFSRIECATRSSRHVSVRNLPLQAPALCMHAPSGAPRQHSSHHCPCMCPPRWHAHLTSRAPDVMTQMGTSQGSHGQALRLAAEASWRSEPYDRAEAMLLIVRQAPSQQGGTFARGAAPLECR